MKPFVSVFILALGAAAIVSAETPQPKPASYEVVSANKRYFVLVDTRSDSTILYQNMSMMIRREMWRIPGYHDSVLVSDDGYVVIGYSGQNFLPLDYTKDLIAFTVYHDGKKTGQVAFGDLLQDFTRLTLTASHYYWGSILSLSNHRLVIETVEGQKVFDIKDMVFVQ